jgi:hypothetical protein
VEKGTKEGGRWGIYGMGGGGRYSVRSTVPPAKAAQWEGGGEGRDAPCLTRGPDGQAASR